MQITIDDDVFAKWALERGYVLLTDISDFAARRTTCCAYPHLPHTPNAETVAALKESAAAMPFDTLTESAAALEQFDDLEPVPSLELTTTHLRGVLEKKGVEAAEALRKEFGFTKISELPEARRREFIAAAEKVMA